jgi:ABC-type sulfate transport system substrate-binding protein
LQYYPSLSEWGRQRLQLDVSAKQELFKDLFAAVDVFDTFDSRPPNAGFANNDIGVVLSLGWSY